METILGCNRWENLQDTVRFARMACDSFEVPDKIDAEYFNSFLLERQKNPVAADIAFYESAKRNNSLLPNMTRLKRFPINDYLVKQQKEEFIRNYPSTGVLRRTLILNDRLSLNKVTPKLTSKFEKCIIKLKSLLYFL